jgi:hypothetical protein
MSLNVLVVPENPTYNGAILKPLCERLFVACGKPHAGIEVLANPRTNGYEDAKRLFPEKILDLYQHKHLILFLPDSDGSDRSAEFARLEVTFEQAAIETTKPIRLICCAAVPEVEAWLLAGHAEKWERDWRWTEMRADRSFKENYFGPFIERHGRDKAGYPDQGRRQLMLEALRNYDGIKQRCPELEELVSSMSSQLLI